MRIDATALSSKRTVAAVFLAAFFLLLAAMDMRANAYDEGIILAGGLNVAGGAVPHRDFYANYGPAYFYLLGFVFKAFGPSFLAARIVDLLIRAGIVAVSLRLLAGRVHPAVAILASGACLLWMLTANFYLYPVFPTLLLSLIGTGLLAPSDGGRAGSKRLFAAGAATGAVALFRYDVGFFVLFAHIAALAVLTISGGGVRAWAGALLRQIVLYGLGLALVFVPAALLLLLAGAGPGFVHDILIYSTQYYARMRSLPWPGPAAFLGQPSAIAVYLPFLAVAASACCFFIERRSRRDRAGIGERSGVDRLLLLLTLLSLVLSVKGLVRTQVIHLLLAIVPATLVLALLVQRRSAWPRPVRALVGAAAALALATPVLHSASLLLVALRSQGTLFAGAVTGIGGLPPGMARAPGVGSPVLPVGSVCAMEYLTTYSRPGEAVLSAAMRHDKLLANDVLLYFASRRRPGTHWYHFDPGLQTRADLQAQIIADLRARGVAWVVRNPAWDAFEEPNESAVSSGVFLLDRYLAAHYRPVSRQGNVQIWLRNDRAAPAPGFRCSQAA